LLHMPLKSGYCVLVGQPISGTGQSHKDDPKSPHYSFIVKTTPSDETSYKIIVNLKSISNSNPDDQANDLLVYLDMDYQAEFVNKLEKWAVDDDGKEWLGLWKFPKISDGTVEDVQIDFQKRPPGGSFPKVKRIPHDVIGSDDDLLGKLNQLVHEFEGDSNRKVYAFGEAFSSNDGLHQIHMNQGNSGRFAKENGAYQDGAMFIRYLDENQKVKWAAFFAMFQSQKLPTDAHGNVTKASIPVINFQLKSKI